MILLNNTNWDWDTTFDLHIVKSNCCDLILKLYDVRKY